MPTRRSTTPHSPRRPRDASDHAWRIAEAVDAAWSAHHSTGTDLHIPVSVVAVLALYRGRANPDGPDPAQMLAQADPADVACLLRAIWRAFITTRPDFAMRVMPLVSWLHDNPSDWQLSGAHTTARAAVRAGILTFAADIEQCRETDLLGNLLQVLRSHRSKAGRGQFYTPQSVAESLALINLGALMAEAAKATERPPGQSIMDPAAGTGALLCGAARVLRQRDLDPADHTWYANDIDPLAAACLAVNAHLWGLGPNVVIGCADGLDPHWIDRAVQDRNDGIIGLRVARQIAALNMLITAHEPPAA
jgi:hypothetical protein